MNFLALVFAIVVGTIAFFFVRYSDKIGKKWLNIVNIGLTICFAICFFHRLINTDEFYDVSNLLGVGINEYNSAGVFTSKTTTFLVYLLRWITEGAMFACLLGAWFDKQSLLKRVLAFIVPIVYLLDIIFFKCMIRSFAFEGAETYTIRVVQFAIECVLGFAIGIYNLSMLISNKQVKASWADNGRTVLLFLAFGFVSAYNCSLYNIIGKCFDKVEMFNLPHFIILLSPIVVYAVLYFLSKNHSHETKVFVMTMLSVGLLIKHSYYYSWFDVSSLPFNLCHFGTVLMPLAMITKNKKLCYFTITNSVIGALFALLIPTAAIDRYITSELGMHFLGNHVYLLVIPTLATALGVFPRMTWKDVKDLLPWNAGYFGLLVLANGLLVNINSGVNFFFMNGNDLVSILTFLKPIKENLVFTFNLGSWHVTVYWLYWILIYLGLNAVTVVGFLLHRGELALGNFINKVGHTFSIVALICSVLVPPLGLVLGINAVRQEEQQGNTKCVIANLSMIVSAVMCLVLFVVLLVVCF